MISMILADIASGETDWADVFFLVALILFVIVAVLRFRAPNLDGALTAVGLAFVAAGFLVL